MKKKRRWRGAEGKQICLRKKDLCPANRVSFRTLLGETPAAQMLCIFSTQRRVHSRQEGSLKQSGQLWTMYVVGVMTASPTLFCFL